MRLLAIVFTVSVLLTSVSSYRILSLVPMPSRSHSLLFERLVSELANRGHQVTHLTPFQQSKPVANLTEVLIPNFYDQLIQSMTGSSGQHNLLSQRNMPAFLGVFMLPIMGKMLNEAVLELPQVQDLLKSDQKFDLVMGETFFLDSVLGGLSWKFQAPLVGISPMMANTLSNAMVGNPAPAAYIPDPMLAYTDHMTFCQRLLNTIQGILWGTVYEHIFLPQQDGIMRKHFGDGAPPLVDIIKNTSLVLVNHHYGLAFPRPYLPNMVEVGGYHIAPAKELPQDLKKYFDNSKNGVILMSMGSHLKSAMLPREKLDAILKAFSRLEYDILWKFEDDTLKNLPKNVKISKWLPQSDILAHPNLKLFITHGGLLSTTEAVYRGVPLVGIPLMGDQPANMRQVEAMGLGVYLDYDELTEDTIVASVEQVLNHPKYAEVAKQRSEYLRDTPLPALDTAIYWIEYVIRYKGAPHLRSAAQDLAWYQLYLLDVLAVLALAATAVLTVQFYTARWLFRKLCGKKQNKTDNQKKKK